MKAKKALEPVGDIREKVAKLIAEHRNDSGVLAVKICAFICNEFGLDGNVWFGNDEAVRHEIRAGNQAILNKLDALEDSQGD